MRRLRWPHLLLTFTLAIAFATAAQAGEIAEKEAVIARTEALLQARDYAGLAQEESEYLQTKARTSAGVWKLTRYYSTIDDWLGRLHRGSGSVCSHEARNFVENWVGATPRSPAATITYAQYLIGEAFCIRGDKVASKVAPRNWAPFLAHIEQARQYLETHKDPAQADPQWFVVMEEVANAQGWDEQRFMTLIKAAQAREPLYYQIYFTAAASYFRPEWNGSLEKIDRFARYAAKSTERWEGTGLYARIYWYLDGERQIPGPMTVFTKIDWGLMKNSMEYVAREYPDRWNTNHFALFSCAENDFKETKYFLDKISGPVMSPPWRDTAQFSDCRTFAMTAKQTYAPPRRRLAGL